MSYRFITDKNGKVVGVESRYGTTKAGKQLGIKVNGSFFNEDGTKLTWYEFIKKIESVGLEYGGETLPIDEDGNTYKIQDVGKWIDG